MTDDLAWIRPAAAHAQVQQAQARLVDVRPMPAFLAGHAAGSVNVPYLRGDFHHIVAHLLAPGDPVLLIADADAAARAAAAELEAAGHRVAGAVDGGFAAWVGAALPTRRMEELDPAAVHESLPHRDVRVIDVRQPREWAGGVIPGAEKIPLNSLADRLGELDPGADYVMVCAHGQRSRQAAWLMLQRGFARVTNLEGGMSAWQEAGLPTES